MNVRIEHVAPWVRDIDAVAAFYARYLGARVGDALAARIAGDGLAVPGAPRRTGDGYYECVVLDPEGNRVEIVA